jgi:FXSXX-COOH protein
MAAVVSILVDQDQTMENTTGNQSAVADAMESDRVPLSSLRVVGTPLEHSLERVVSASASGHVAIAAFSSSI